MTLLATVALWRLVILVQWSWYEDDWVYLHEASATPFRQYVTAPYNGHLMPLQFALVWVLQRLAPLRHEWAVVLVWMLATAASSAWAVLLRRVFGRRWCVIVALVPITLAPALTPLTIWTAAALQLYGMHLGAALLLLAVVAHTRTGSRGSWWRLVVTFGCVLLWWQKALLLAVPAIGLALLLARDPNGRLDRRRVARLVAGLGAPAAALVAWYLPTAHVSPGGELGQLRSASDVARYVWAALTQSLLPLLVGGPWRVDARSPRSPAAPPALLQWLLFALALGVGLWALSRRRHGAIIAATALALLAIDWGLVLSSHRFDIGVAIAVDPRYHLDLVPVVVLFGMLLLVPAVGERGWRRAGAGPVRVPRWAAPSLATALAVSALSTHTAQWERLRATSPKPWVDALLGEAASAGGVAVVDGNTPNTVMTPAFFPGTARVSYLLGPLHHGLRFDVPAERLMMIDDQGRLRPAEVGRYAAALPGPVPNCGYVIKPGERAFVPMTRAVYPWTWGITVGYLAQTDGVLRVTTRRVTTELPVSRGVGEVSAVVTDSVDAVQLSVAAGTGTVCVDTVRVGGFAPVGQGTTTGSPG